jgi:predicted nucleotidyltransferase
MRLREKDRLTIKQAAREVFGDDVVVRLFGSRVDDALKGGDIDLHLEIDPQPDGADRSARTFWSLLQERLGEQQIDVVVSERGKPQRAIERIAYKEGVEL